MGHAPSYQQTSVVSTPSGNLSMTDTCRLTSVEWTIHNCIYYCKTYFVEQLIMHSKTALSKQVVSHNKLWEKHVGIIMNMYMLY